MRAIGCSEEFSTEAASRRTSSGVTPAAGATSRHFRFAAGNGAGLVEYHDSDRAHQLDRLAVADQDSVLRAESGGDHQRRRRGEPHRARAGDDEHRDSGEHGQRQGRHAGNLDPRQEAGRPRRDGAHRVREEEPEQERRQGGGEDDRDEDAGDAVGELLDGQLGTLRFADDADDLREEGVAAHARGADAEEPVQVDRGADDGVAGLLVHRQRLAARGGFVHGAFARDDLAVGRDLLARADDEHVADFDRFAGNDGFLPVAFHARRLRAEFEQQPERAARARPGAGLDVAAGQMKGHDHGGDGGVVRHRQPGQ